MTTTVKRCPQCNRVEADDNLVLPGRWCRLLDSKTWNGVFDRYEFALRRATCKGVKHPNASYISIELTLEYEPAIIRGGGEINRNFLAV